MTAAATTFVCAEPTAILDRHTVRRSDGIATVSLLVGPVGIGGRTWRGWAAATGRKVIVADPNGFPLVRWLRAVAEQVDLLAMAVQCLAGRAGREPEEFAEAWLAKTAADRERFWKTLVPGGEDDLLRAMATPAAGDVSSDRVAEELSNSGERVVSLLVRLAPSCRWPAVLFVAESTERLLAVGPVAAQRAERVPAIPVAVTVPAGVWDEYLATAPE